MPDLYPGDLLQDFRALQKRVDELEAQLKGRPGMTTASAGWRLSAMATPDTSSLDAAAGHIYFKGGRLTARNGGNGSEIQLEPPITIGDPGDATSTDAGATYGTTERDLINQLKSRFNALLDTMRFNDFIV